MACATLKRSLDWEAINQRPTKRRRCNPFGHHTTDNGSPLRSHRFLGKSNCSNATASPSSSYTAPDDNLPLYSPKCRLGMEQQQPPQHSPFAEASLSKISAETMAKNVRVEIKRLHKRKQLPLSSTAIERMQDSESSGSEMGAESPLRPESPPSIVRNPEKALFTFKQVQLICQRMLQDREDELRENYDAVLTTKLAEQYDAFVKFTYDQIQRRYEAAPSYLS